MRKLLNVPQSYQAKLIVFSLLLLTVPGCFINRTGENSRAEKKAENLETSEKKKTRDLEKLKTQAEPKDNEETALSSATEDLKRQVCRKYDDCGSQDYEECIEEAMNLDYNDEVWACMLDSSCESLRDGKPNACLKTQNNRENVAPDVPDCSGTSCTRNSDCPGGCHGGCSEGRCYLF